MKEMDSPRGIGGGTASCSRGVPLVENIFEDSRSRRGNIVAHTKLILKKEERKRAVSATDSLGIEMQMNPGGQSLGPLGVRTFPN